MTEQKQNAIPTALFKADLGRKISRKKIFEILQKGVAFCF
jgi:hypothetical protein